MSITSRYSSEQTSAYAFAIDTDTDEQIMFLNRDLTRLQETLRPVLDETEFRYVFQGLGCSLSASLIRSVRRFHRISESGVMKMCRNIFSIEQVLAQIGLVGDAELMRAHRFYEFLSLVQPEDLLSLVEEYGTDYTEEDYLRLLQLQYRSSFENEDFDLKQYEQLIKKAFRPQ